jgi:hypothetical protein
MYLDETGESELQKQGSNFQMGCIWASGFITNGKIHSTV